MNPTRHNHLFSYDRKGCLDLLKSRVVGIEIVGKDLEQEYTYKAPRKLTESEYKKVMDWFYDYFPKEKQA